MKLNFLRIIGPKPKDEEPPPPPPPAEKVISNPLRGRGGHYLASDPARSDHPGNPEIMRVFAPHTVAEVNDYVGAFEDREGWELTEDQHESLLAQAEAWLENQDQDYAEYVEGLLEDLATQREPESAAEAAAESPA